MNCPPAWHHAPSVRSGEAAYEINKQIKGLGRMISTERPQHITVLRLPRPAAWIYKSSGVAGSGVTSSLVLAHTHVFRGAHQATSKLGSSPFPASSLRTIWPLRKVVFNMQPTALTKSPISFWRVLEKMDAELLQPWGQGCLCSYSGIRALNPARVWNAGLS